ncbi:glycosyltransferase [Microbacterium testaceum]|uniref:glycosyltransferase n=1 Tax=Microbacterium testaceum TaxID=2033 RepID=UPI003417434E
MYLAVLPSYRRECIAALLNANPAVELYCAEAHLNRSVRTGIDPSLYTRTKLIRFRGKAFLQLGSWRRALRLKNLIVDLNPRSGTAWILLSIRRLLGRRTVVWGHLHPRAEGKGGTARRTMRRLAHGTVCYTYTQASEARQEMPEQPVWVAPNALYRQDQLRPGQTVTDRDAVLYVGRLEEEKRVDLFVDAFAASGLSARGVRAIVVGYGEKRRALEVQAELKGVGDSIVFAGQIESPEALAKLYDQAFCSVSPGFGGLGITQSMGFGVPIVITAGIQHSPEIELVEHWPSATYWARGESAEFGRALQAAFNDRSNVPRNEVQRDVRLRYSAESMAAGLLDALRGENEEKG